MASGRSYYPWIYDVYEPSTTLGLYPRLPALHNPMPLTDPSAVAAMCQPLAQTHAASSTLVSHDNSGAENAHALPSSDQWQHFKRKCKHDDDDDNGIRDSSDAVSNNKNKTKKTKGRTRTKAKTITSPTKELTVMLDLDKDTSPKSQPLLRRSASVPLTEPSEDMLETLFVTYATIGESEKQNKTFVVESMESKLEKDAIDSNLQIAPPQIARHDVNEQGQAIIEKVKAEKEKDQKQEEEKSNVKSESCQAIPDIERQLDKLRNERSIIMKLKLQLQSAKCNVDIFTPLSRDKTEEEYHHKLKSIERDIVELKELQKKQQQQEKQKRQLLKENTKQELDTTPRGQQEQHKEQERRSTRPRDCTAASEKDIVQPSMSPVPQERAPRAKSSCTSWNGLDCKNKDYKNKDCNVCKYQSTYKKKQTNK
ncbi:trichohyalin [Reticulomyxa filosa]|uniref:Trichohyalin n=1 Tax=Reticulomyxa filosa TaxID=46433 RepID=X6MRM4_RETFI|nr:trichohyalin [Reticulomyxa filosa]|eukprot:ETO16102.1 trichohyalin [Reticulomyxa filosa]